MAMDDINHTTGCRLSCSRLQEGKRQSFEDQGE